MRNEAWGLIDKYPFEHVVCNGDLFDKFEVDTGELIKAYEIFADHLKTGKLTLIMGNHDASAKGSKVSSFHLLSHFLSAHSPDKFRMIDNTDGFCHVENNVWAISHQMNQDLFNLEINKACAEDGSGKYLLLHCNFKNGHAENSEHSLNLNDDHVAALMIAGWSCVLGHEHAGVEYRGGRVIVVGNQFPSSVADCIGDQTKAALEITNRGHEHIVTWVSDGHYAEIDWRELSENVICSSVNFIRVTGEATAAEAADVISIISKFRQGSSVLVIGNAVRVDGVAALEEMSAEAIGEVRSFDVLGAIFENLDEREITTVKELLDA